MIIERRIKIDKRDFFLGIEIKFGKDKIIKKADGSNFDMGDLSIMIEYFEEKYKQESQEMIYDDYIPYMNNVIYLYDRFPFISYIKNVSYGKDGNITYLSCINKDEIIDYINKNKIQMNRWNKKECHCPLLYE